MFIMEIDKFNEIKKYYGDCGSWAIWAESNEKVKSNVGDLSVLDPEVNSELLNQLKPELVFVGLNFSSIDDLTPFSNFHSPNSKAQDFKIRYALKNTEYWGSYMTDIIKNFEEKKSKIIKKIMKEDRNLEKINDEIMMKELGVLGVENKMIVAFGRDTYNILERNLGDNFNIHRVTHYSHFINKEKYREELKNFKSSKNSLD